MFQLTRPVIAMLIRQRQPCSWGFLSDLAVLPSQDERGLSNAGIRALILTVVAANRHSRQAEKKVYACSLATGNRLKCNSQKIAIFPCRFSLLVYNIRAISWQVFLLIV